MIELADLPRLRQILASLQPADATWLADQLEPAWVRRQRRLAARDEAIREAASLMGASTMTAAVEQLARTLKRYLASSGWIDDARRSAPPTDAPELHALLFAIASGNDGESIGQKQLYRIVKGSRTPFP